MTFTYLRAEPPADPARLDELEAHLGQVIPTDYREHLTRHDGGRMDNNSGALNTVFGVGDVPEYASLWGILGMRGDRVPEWLLPVADDAYGNLFCLSLREADEGSVWLWNHEEEADEGEPPSDDNLTHKADTWTAFLADLQAAGKPSRCATGERMLTARAGAAGTFADRDRAGAPVSASPSIWADGIETDTDTVVALEVRYVAQPGNSPYEGLGPDTVREDVLDVFDTAIARYEQVMADDHNPITRLRIITNTEAAARFLERRAILILGVGCDLDVQMRPESPR
jgi:hypothetical protein